MFGGAKPAFGQTTANNSFGFGGQAPAQSPFGQSLQFGKPATTSAFGNSTTTFGAPQTTSLFGSNQPSGSGLFGQTANTTAAFGTTTPQTGFGGFAQQQQSQPTTLFGTQNNTTQNTSLFGNNNNNNSAFGVAKPQTGFGAFGQPAQQTSLFGQPSTSGTSTTGFGSFGAQQATSGGLFGAAKPAFGAVSATGANGTAIAKYSPVIGTDTLVKNGNTSSVNTKQQCITFMKEYEAKSLEELRHEDYTANRKGPQAGAGGAGMFGQAPSNSLFGANPSQPTLFGQTNAAPMSSGLFGSTPSAFGQQTTNTFASNNQPAGGGLFGAAKPFGATTTTSSAFGGFGTTNTSTLGGASQFGQAQGGGGLFGKPAQPAANAFGAATNSFGGFGAQQTSTPSLFGGGTATNTVAPNNSTFGGFGATQQPTNTFGGFGANTNTNTTSGGLFGAKPAQPMGGGMGTFGNTATSTAPTFGGFGQPNQSGSLFGNAFNKPAAPAFGVAQNTNPMGTGLGGFGNTSGSLFGQTQNKQTFGTGGTGGGLFGSTQPMGGGLGTNSFGMGAPSFGSSMNPQQPTMGIHDHILAMTNNPYGDNPIFKDLKPLSGPSENALKPTNPSAQKAILEGSMNNFKVSPKVSNGVKIKPITYTNLTKKSLFDGLEEYDSTLEESFSLKPNAKRLVLRPKPSQSANNSNISALNASTSYTKKDESFQNQIPTSQPETNDTSRRVSWLQSNALEKVRQNARMSESILDNTIKDLVTVPEKPNESLSLPQNKSVQETTSSPTSPQSPSDSILSNKSYLNESVNPDISILEEVEPHPTGIVLRRSGYYTIPSLDEIATMVNEDGRFIVPDFTIGRRGYGNVYFSEPIDVTGMNLDEIVHFRNKEVVIYPDDENKPPVGHGLNRKAQITLDQVWPQDKELHAPIKDADRLNAMDYEGKLRRVCDKHDTRFLEFRPDTGSWVFRVNHFSKYGLSDSDDEETVPVDPKKLKMIQQQQNQSQILGPKASTVAQTGLKKGFETAVGNNQSIMNRSLQSQYSFYQDDSLVHAPTSPSAALAMEMGTDSHKLQLMKASFFVDDDFDGRSMMSDTSLLTFGRESPDQMVPDRLTFNVNRTLPMENDVPMSDEPIFTLAQKINEIPKPVPPKTLPLILHPRSELVNTDIVIPMGKSVLSQIMGKCRNLSVFNGRKFKPGWSFPNTFVQLNTADVCKDLPKECSLGELSKFFAGRHGGDYSKSSLQMVHVRATNKIQNFEETVEDHLEVQLRYDVRKTADGSDCPYFEANGRQDALVAHYATSKGISNLGEIESYGVSVWALCNALWGHREELEDLEESAHATVMIRRDLFSEWIEEVISEKSTNMKDNLYMDQLLEHLFTHKVLDACELAFENNDVNLSMLLSQLSGGPSVRQLMQHQLSSWQDVEADRFIAIKRLKPMMLVAGIPSLASSHGPINIFEDVDWLKALAINLWYMCSPTASITDALISYEKAFETSELYIAPPSPPYAEQYKTTNPRPLYDLRFHILKLYSVRSHPMEALLNPATHTADPTDFRLSWFLMQVLETLGYHHCSDLSKSQIHVSFANQLENYGLWHWSIYVLMHISDQNRRELTIQDMIYRNIQLSDEDAYLEKEKFITVKLGIPEKWIYWAKAVRAGSEYDHHQQAKYLLKAKQWSMAHEIIIEHIAPDCIINDDVPYLKSLLAQFENTKEISNWSIKGQILKDFIELNEKFDLIKDGIDDEVDQRLEELKPKLSDLCSVIKMFPCPTPKHRLCQSEIAQRLAYLISAFFTTSQQVSACAILRIALEKLPLPQEYAQDELRHMLSAFLKEDIKLNE